MMKSSKRRAAEIAAAQRLKAWTRRRFALPTDCTIFAAEVACGLPGCPPIETVVSFWTAPDRRHSFKVFKPMCEVAEVDLPPSWMKDAIICEQTPYCC